MYFRGGHGLHLIEPALQIAHLRRGHGNAFRQHCSWVMEAFPRANLQAPHAPHEVLSALDTGRISPVP